MDLIKINHKQSTELFPGREECDAYGYFVAVNSDADVSVRILFKYGDEYIEDDLTIKYWWGPCHWYLANANGDPQHIGDYYTTIEEAIAVAEYYMTTQEYEIQKNYIMEIVLKELKESELKKLNDL